MSLLFEEESYKIIGAALEVHKNLGSGFLEGVYQEAMEMELAERKIPFVVQQELKIIYKGKTLNKKYYADIVCFDKIIVELKVSKTISSEYVSQVLNYLNAANFKLGLLINFGSESLEVKRIVL
jgi:GxxExxY protein